MTELPSLPTGVATGIGSMPGEDQSQLAEATRTVLGELPDFPHLPELPGRSAAASMTGRASALLVDLAVDLQPAGWRLADAPGLDQRRAVSLLNQDLDTLEELAQGYTGPMKVQVAGPWTLAATLERPRGDKVLADHGARREVAQSMAEGVTNHLRDLRRRLPDVQPVLQIDEPSLPAVLAARVPTASGFGRHRFVDVPEAVEVLRWWVDVSDAARTPAVLHCCAPQAPLEVAAKAGFRAVAVDAALLGETEYDSYAEALDGGIDVWLGILAAEETVPAGALADRVRRLAPRLGLEPERVAERVVLTPTCGLAGASPAGARQVLQRVRDAARQVSVGQARMDP
ncbi:MAG TPA: methionine synthase [Nocardioidaceae bacterium]|nr:methionine synthase [Nocardioidaceae bacterium]